MPDPSATLRDHAAGSLLGCAIGDAVGEIAFRHPIKHDLRQALSREETLVYTDDTAMAIGLAALFVGVVVIRRVR